MRIIALRCQIQAKRKTLGNEKKQTSFEKALDRKQPKHIIGSRLKNGRKQGKLSDKKIAEELRDWSGKSLDRKTDLNIIDKPVSRNGFVLTGKSIKT